MKKIITNCFWIFIAGIFLLSCTPKNETAFIPSSGSKASNSDQSLVVRLAVNDTYCKQTACACIHNIAAREYFDIQKRLKKEYNIDLQLTYFMETYEMEDAMRAKKFDGVICKPWTAYMLADKAGITYKRVADVLDAYNNQWLTGVFLVRKDSPMKSMKDINGKTLVAGQIDAYEKYHMPYYLLDREKIQLGKIYEKASCLESINELIDRKADVAVVSDYVMKASCAVDVASADDFRTIGTTEKMPLCSVILDMAKVSEADALRLQNALLAISGKKSPESMLSDGFVKPASWCPNPYVDVKVN